MVLHLKQETQAHVALLIYIRDIFFFCYTGIRVCYAWQPCFIDRDPSQMSFSTAYCQITCIPISMLLWPEYCDSILLFTALAVPSLITDKPTLSVYIYTNTHFRFLTYLFCFCRTVAAEVRKQIAGQYGGSPQLFKNLNVGTTTSNTVSSWKGQCSFYGHVYCFTAMEPALSENPLTDKSTNFFCLSS